MIPRKAKYDYNYHRENEINTCTLDKIQRLSDYLTKDDAETYKLYLACRPDLGDTVKQYYLDLIQKIEANEKRNIEEALKILKDVSEYQNN
jgi:hypothetical protein